MKIISILLILSVIVEVTFAQSTQKTTKATTSTKLTTKATTPTQPTTTVPLPKTDLCNIQSRVIGAINGFSLEGQKSAKKILLDVQHELSNVIQKQYTAIKAQNGATLAKLQATEGVKLTAFYSSIGFNNASAFSESQVDLCQIQADMNAALNKMQPASQLTITKTVAYYLNQAKPDLNNVANVIMKKDQGVILQLYNTENQSQLMILANVLESVINTK